jgi:hypothetical protein
MFPGYGSGAPYCSPILVTDVTPLKTGKAHLRVCFWNAFYAEGVRDFDLTLRVLQRAPRHLVLMHGERSAVISAIEFGWLSRMCPAFWSLHPLEQRSHEARSCVQRYLWETLSYPRDRTA